MVVAGGGHDGAAQPGQLGGQRLGRRGGLEVGLEPRHVGGVEPRRGAQRAQRLGAGRIDEQAPDLAQHVVAGGAVDRQGGLQRLVDGQDLLDDDVGVRPGQLAQPAQICHRVGQPVGMIDAHPVDQPLVEPALDLDVAGVEHLRVLLAQTRQRGDREEPPIAAHIVPPAHQPVVLTVVYLRAAAPGSAGRDGEAQVAQRQRVAIDGQRRDVLVGAEDGQHDAPVGVQIPVDVEEFGEPRVPAVPQHVPPPGIQLGLLDPDVVGHDVDQQAHAAGPGRPRQRGQRLGPAEFGGHRRRVGDVVAVGGTAYRGEQRRQVDMADAQVVEVVEEIQRIGQGEPVAAQLQTVGGQHRPGRGHDVFRRTSTDLGSRVTVWPARTTVSLAPVGVAVSNAELHSCA